MAYLFPGHALPPAVRARIELLRDRASSPAGWVVTCGGSSMEPVLRRGERVAIRAQPPRRGAVAAFVTSRGDLELHRLVAAAPGGWWAHLGDNQVDPAPGLVHTSQIVGVAALPVRVPHAVERARALARFAHAAARVTLHHLRAR